LFLLFIAPAIADCSKKLYLYLKKHPLLQVVLLTLES
jgi:hypothetical protein